MPLHCPNVWKSLKKRFRSKHVLFPIFSLAAAESGTEDSRCSCDWSHNIALFIVEWKFYGGLWKEPAKGYRPFSFGDQTVGLAHTLLVCPQASMLKEVAPWPQKIYICLRQCEIYTMTYSSNRWAHTLLSKPVFQELKKPKWSASALGNASYVHTENVCMALVYPSSRVLQCLLVTKLISEGFYSSPFLARKVQGTLCEKTYSPILIRPYAVRTGVLAM